MESVELEISRTDPQQGRAERRYLPHHLPDIHQGVWSRSTNPVSRIGPRASAEWIFNGHLKMVLDSSDAGYCVN